MFDESAGQDDGNYMTLHERTAVCGIAYKYIQSLFRAAADEKVCHFDMWGSVNLHMGEELG